MIMGNPNPVMIHSGSYNDVIMSQYMNEPIGGRARRNFMPDDAIIMT